MIRTTGTTPTGGKSSPMKRQKRLAMIYEMSALCGITIKIIDQKQAGEISEDEFKSKLGEMKKHLAAFGSKYSGGS